MILFGGSCIRLLFLCASRVVKHEGTNKYRSSREIRKLSGLRTYPRIFGNFVKLLKSTAPSSATLANYSFLLLFDLLSHTRSPTLVRLADAFRVRTYIRASCNTLRAVIFSFISSLSLSPSVRLFLHFPGPLAPEEDISFHSVITGEPNLHNTRVARAYRHLHFILIAVID